MQVHAHQNHSSAITRIAPTIQQKSLKSLCFRWSAIEPVWHWLQKRSVDVWAKEPWIRIPLHKTIYNFLGIIETQFSGSLNVLFDDLPRSVVDVYLGRNREWWGGSSLTLCKRVVIFTLCIPLWELLPWCKVRISSWPLRSAWMKSLFFWNLHRPAKIRCSHRWTRTWGKRGTLLCHLKETMKGKHETLVPLTWTGWSSCMCMLT